MADINEIKRLLQHILDYATEESQYSDFLDEFLALEAIITSFGREHPLWAPHMAMERSMYINKGDLDCSMHEILAFSSQLKNYK